jgi:hypothetical protein
MHTITVHGEAAWRGWIGLVWNTGEGLVSWKTCASFIAFQLPTWRAGLKLTTIVLSWVHGVYGVRSMLL